VNGWRGEAILNGTHAYILDIMSEIVFILGAGASCDAGAPLMKDFLNRAEALAKTFAGTPFAQSVATVADAQDQLQRVLINADFEVNNIEWVFGAIEMARLIGRFPGKTEPEIEALSAAIKKVIVGTLEHSMKFRYRQSHVHPTETYGRFAELIRDLDGRTRTPRATVLTFNYDIGLDYALSHSLAPPEYSLDPSTGSNGPLLLKLHGSLNWGRCTQCSTILPLTTQVWFAKRMYVEDGDVELSLGSNLSQLLVCTRNGCIGAPDASPVLVPPTWNKTEYHNALRNVWRRAANELGEAEQIYVIGYSLPESDMFFRHLYALGAVGKRRLKRFVAIDPEESVGAKYRLLLGGHASRGYEFRNGTFGNSLNGIKQDLLGGS